MKRKGITFFGIVYIICGSLCIFLSIFFGLIFSAMRYIYLQIIPYQIPFMLSLAMWLIVLFLLVYGVLEIVMGIGLLKLKNWARAMVMILSVIAILAALFTLVFSLLQGQWWVLYLIAFVLQLIIPMLGIWYFSKRDIKRVFSQKY